MARDLEDDDELRRAIEAEGLHSEEAENLMRSAMSETAREAKLIAPHRTGLMASRIRWSVQESAGGVTGKVTAPAPANLLSTRSGIRKQLFAWGHRLFPPLEHPAHDPFLKRAFYETAKLFRSDD
jgi:hypothetical protein